MEFKLAFAGFGVVARGLCEILTEKREMLKDRYGLEWTVVAVSDFKLGSIADPDGIDIDLLMKSVADGDRVDDLDAPEKGWDVLTMIEKTNANTLVEVTYTDVKTGEPAMSHVKAALNRGMHVVSTNKGPVIKEMIPLNELAASKGVTYGVEGVVMAGTPVLNLIDLVLAGNNITEAKGIVNGTTNYILTKMGEGMEYADALQKAQELGYAEADPTGDVEGWDALGKVVVLSNILFNADIGWGDVEREGIDKITLEDIKAAAEEGLVYKLIACTKLMPDGTVEGSVQPLKLPPSDPLSGISGATNAMTFVTDELGPVTIIGPGAGKRETGFALLIDMINICRSS